MSHQLFRCKSSDEFYKRYYQWALEDAEREVRQGFPFISKIKDRGTLRFLAVMEPLSLDQQLNYALILVKNSFKNLLNDKSISSDTENSLYRQLLVEEKKTERQLYEQGKLNTLNTKVNLRKLRNLIDGELSQVYGNMIQNDGNNRFAYKKVVGFWEIDTHIFLGGRDKLNYMQIIKPVCETDLQLKALTADDLLVWLGIGRMGWNLMTDEDAPSAAKTLTNICTHFTDIVPNLLAGLSPDLEVCES